MKFISLSYLVLFLLFYCSSCCVDKNKITDVNENIFQTNPHTSYKSIINQGFKRIPVDVERFEKQKRDTLIQLEMDDDLKAIRFQGWKVKLSSFKYDDLINFFKEQRMHIITPIDEFNYLDKNFCIIHVKKRKIFICNFSKDSGILYLNVKYNYHLVQE